jgi:DNA-binding MarR family transcriptional regulator
MGRLGREIKQERPFATLEEEVFLNLQRTADALSRRLVETLKQSDLTPTQYNALRILRGAGDDGLPCREVGERMVTRDPDVTRLLDRMEARGFVARGRDGRDRRVITVRITEQGRSVLDATDPSVSALLVSALAHLGRERLRSLNELLEAARGAQR